MANNTSNYARKAMLDWLLGGATPTRPTSRYLGLDYGTPTSTGVATEATYSGNTRRPITFAAANASGTASAAANASFAAVSYSNTIRGYHIWDTQSTGVGNLLWAGTISAATSPAAASAFTFNAGSILFTAL